MATLTIFDWMELIVVDIGQILTMSAWNSIAMGAVTFVLASVALFFNHYNWKRVRVLCSMTILGLVGWVILKILILGRAGFEEDTLTTAFSITLSLFICVGFVLAGLISDITPNPVTRIKVHVVELLRKLATRIEATIVDIAEIRQIRENKIAETVVETIASTMAKTNPS